MCTRPQENIPTPFTHTHSHMDGSHRHMLISPKKPLNPSLFIHVKFKNKLREASSWEEGTEQEGVLKLFHILMQWPCASIIKDSVSSTGQMCAGHDVFTRSSTFNTRHCADHHRWPGGWERRRSDSQQEGAHEASLIHQWRALSPWKDTGIRFPVKQSSLIKSGSI